MKPLFPWRSATAMVLAVILNAVASRVVKNGRVTLEGAVATEADENIAGIHANGVPGVFSATNNLRLDSEK